MTIYEALKKDHIKVKTLIDELLEVGKTNERRRAKLLIEEIRDELIPHSRAEEAVFYNVLTSIEQAQPLVIHNGFQEHIEAETILKSLQAKDEIDAEWMLLARKFKKAIETHIQEEEDEIFATAQKFVSENDAEMMAQAFEELKPHVPKEGLLKETLDLVVHLMPPKYVATLRTMTLRSDPTVRPHIH